MDKKDAIAVIVILAGLGLTQVEWGPNEFFVGLGWGSIAIGCFWLLLSVRKELKKSTKKNGSNKK